jgi:hypothetical protein
MDIVALVLFSRGSLPRVAVLNQHIFLPPFKPFEKLSRESSRKKKSRQAPGNERGYADIKDYVVLPRGEDNPASSTHTDYECPIH